MINGRFEIYDIAPDGTRTLVSKSTNDLIPDTWQLPLRGIDGIDDIVLFKEFGSGIDLRIVLRERRIIKSFDRDLVTLRNDLSALQQQIADAKLVRAEKQKELDDLLAEIEQLKQEIIDSENLINTARDRINQLKTEIPQAKRNVQLKQEQITQLLRQKALLENDVRRYTEQIESQEIIINNLQVDIESIRNQILNQLETISSNSDIQSLNHQKQQVQSTINNLESQIRDKSDAKVIAEAEFVRLRDVWIQKDTDNAPDASQAKQDMDNKQAEINAIQKEIDALNADKKIQLQNLATVEEQLIAKGFELFPDLATLKQRKEQKETEHTEANQQLQRLKDQLKIASDGVTSSDENKQYLETELAQLQKVVTDKEQEQVNTQTALMQAQATIVSNTNAIPVKENDIPKYQEAVKIEDDKLAELNEKEAQINKNLNNLKTTRDEREAQINTIAQATYIPADFNKDDSQLNLTPDEVLELGNEGTTLTETKIIGGIPQIIRHTFSDGLVFYGLYQSAVWDMINPMLNPDVLNLPTEIKPFFKFATYFKSTANSIPRAYRGYTLIESDGTSMYRRTYHISKLHSVVGSYHYIGVSYGDIMLSLAFISRNDDNAKSLIINEGHRLEVNYMFDFLAKDDKDFTYTFNVDDTVHTAKVIFGQMPDATREQYYMSSSDKLVNMLYRKYSLKTVGNRNDQRGFIRTHGTGSNMQAEIIAPYHAKITHNKYTEVDDEFIVDNNVSRLYSIGFDLEFNANNQNYFVEDYMRIDIEPPIEIHSMSMNIPVPITKDLFQMNLQQYEGYKGREFSFIDDTVNAKMVFDLATGDMRHVINESE